MQPKPGDFWSSSRFLLGSLVAANLAAVVVFILQDGSVIQALWIYWAQSVIIGFVNVLRILSLPLDNLTLTNSQTGQTISGKSFGGLKTVIRVVLAGFFTMHYGAFHFGYMIFLLALSDQNTPMTVNGTPVDFSLGEVSAAIVLLVAAGFAVHHVLSFIHEKQQQVQQNEHAFMAIGSAMMRPYARIIPMHIIIIAAPFVAMAFNTATVFVVFMVLKTVADIALYKMSFGHPKVIAAMEHAAQTARGPKHSSPSI